MKIWTRNIVILLMALCFVGCKPKQPPQPAPKDSPKPPVTREVEPPAPAEPVVVADQAAPSQAPATEEPASEDEPPLKALIVTGQSAEWHPWRVSSPVLKQYLEETGLFAVDVAKTPEKGGNMETYRPKFSDYDVVVIDYEGDNWSESIQTEFVEYVRAGGGVVFYHAANNNFPEWKEFNEIAGLSGWGDRDEKWGPMVRYRDGKVVLDYSPGEAGEHGPAHEFQVINREREHPVTAALPEKWMHARDELYSELRGPAKNLTVLATAYADPEQDGTGEHEPILFTISYGKGRVFHTVLGHANERPITSLECVGFIATFQRGAEWAATGKVTQKVPEDFPKATRVSRRKESKVARLDELLDAIAAYEYGQSRERLTELTELLRAAYDSPQKLGRIEEQFLQFLRSDATLASKQFICRQLSIIGSEEAAETLAGMLEDAETSDMARFALERIPGAEIDEVLREALANTDGTERIGIINTLGARGDRRSAAVLGELIYDSDQATATAAVGALGRIASTRAAKVLSEAGQKTKGELQLLVLDSYLKCADKLVGKGKKKKALEIYRQMYQPDIPEIIRIAAFRGMVTLSDDEAVGIILDALKTGDETIGAIAIGLVREVPQEQEITAVAEKLPNLSVTGQVQLLSALADRGDRRVLPAVIAVTGSDDESVRIAALQAAGKLGNASSARLLAQRASETRGTEREAARQSLYQLRGAEVDAAILEEVSRADAEVKVELIRGIEQRGIGEAVPALLKAVRDSESKVRLQSFRALRAVADRDYLPELIGLLINVQNEIERREAERVVTAVANTIPERDRRADEVLAVLPSVRNVEARCSLLHVLGKLQDDDALAVLRAALEETNAKIREAAIRGLGDWHTDEPAEELLKTAKSSDNETHRVLALRGFIRLIGLDSNRPAEETIDMYRLVMDLSANVSEKKMVLSGLAGVESIAALKMAAEYLEDRALQREAAAAVVNIAEAISDSYPEETRALLEKVLRFSRSGSIREQAEEVLEQIE